MESIQVLGNLKSRSNQVILVAVVMLLFALVLGYHRIQHASPDEETLQRIGQERAIDPNVIEKNRMEVLFMQERGWYFMAFATLTLTMVVWIGLTHRKHKTRTPAKYKLRLTRQLKEVVQAPLNFQERLKLKFESLTDHDLLLAEMLLDGLSSKQIATELNISPASVNTARYRLRKRMQLAPDDHLIDFLNQI